MILSHSYHLFPSKIMASFGYDSVRYFPCISHKSTDIIGYDSVTYLPFISLIIIIRIYFYHRFTINLPRKYWNRLDMILPHIYHVFPSELLASSGYNIVTYLRLISFINTAITCIRFCYIFAIDFLNNIGLGRIWLCRIFTIYFLQKYWHHLDVVLSYFYHFSPSWIFASFKYGWVKCLRFIFLKNTGIIWIWFCQTFTIYFLCEYWYHCHHY